MLEALRKYGSALMLLLISEMEIATMKPSAVYNQSKLATWNEIKRKVAYHLPKIP